MPTVGLLADYFFANNIGLYTNSQQSTRMLHTWFGRCFLESDLALNYVMFRSDHQKLVGNLRVAMTSLLHHAAERPFCVCQLLHFCQLLSNPSTDLKLEYISKKPMKRRFQRCICPYGNIINFSCMSQIHFWYKILHWNHWANGGKWPQNPSFPLSHVEPQLIHECLGWPHSQPKQQLNRCTHFHTTMPQRTHWLEWDSLFPFNNHHSHLIHLCLDWPHSPSQTAFGSNQTFCHNTLCLLTDRLTDRDRQMVQANVP